MTQKIAVVVIHGVGDQQPSFADEMIEALKHRFATHFPFSERGAAADELIFRPAFWADILSSNEKKLWNLVNPDANLDYVKLRKFIMNFAADAIAYQPGKERRQVYDAIHARMAAALADLAREEVAGPQAPLCVIGHSLGTIITHNFFYDRTRSAGDSAEEALAATPLESGDTLALLYTLGSPLALWSLRYSFNDDYTPLRFPGRAIPTLYPNVQPHWINFYDEDDVLAYPIRKLSTAHQEMAAQGLLEDRPVNVGSVLASWNPMAHTAYDDDDDVLDPVACHLAELWKQVNGVI